MRHASLVPLVQGARVHAVAVATNRWRQNTVLIFDRTLFDDVASRLAGRQKRGGAKGRGLAGAEARMIAAHSPRFDAMIYLAAEPEEIVRRRPEIGIADAKRASDVYAEIGSALSLVPLNRITIVK